MSDARPPFCVKLLRLVSYYEVEELVPVELGSGPSDPMR
jgi:hypothetical protein